MKEFLTVLSAVVPTVVAMSAFLYWVVRMTVRDTVREEIAKLNGTYVRAVGSTVTGAEIERRLTHMEERCEARHEA